MTRLLALAAELRRDWPLYLTAGITIGEDGRGFTRAGVWEDDWNAWIILWPPGVAKGAHDHCDSDALYVILSGEIVEKRWNPATIEYYKVDSHGIHVPPRTPHDVWAVNDWAIGLHIYSPRLEKMTLYHQDGKRVLGYEHVGR